jgi:hypothetical protein
MAGGSPAATAPTPPPGKLSNNDRVASAAAGWTAKGSNRTILSRCFPLPKSSTIFSNTFLAPLSCHSRGWGMICSIIICVEVLAEENRIQHLGIQSKRPDVADHPLSPRTPVPVQFAHNALHGYPHPLVLLKVCCRHLQ